MKRAATYIRMSTDEQDGSPERQRQQVLPYCQRNGYTVVREYADLGERGWDDSRPQFNRMLADAQRGMFDVIVVDEMSRLSRSDYYSFMEVVVLPLRKCGVKVDTVVDGLANWDDPDDLAASVMSLFRQHKSSGESKQLGYRTATGQLKNARERRMWVGNPLYGYRFITKDGTRINLEIDPDSDAANIVRRIFSAYLHEDLSCAAIAARLNANGIPAPGGAGWNSNAIKRTLKNHRYAGAYTYGKCAQGRYYRTDGREVKATPKGATKSFVRHPDEYLIIPGNHAPIIEPAVFDAVQERLAQNRVRTGPSRKQGIYPFGQKLVCGCGATMYGAPRFSGRKWESAYRCGANMTGKGCHPRMVTEEKMVNLLAQVLHDIFLDPTQRARLVAEMERQRTDTPGREEAVAELRRKISHLERDVTKAKGNLALLDPEYIDGVQAQIKGWEVEAAAAKRELGQLLTNAEAASPEALIGRVERFVEVLKTASPAELRPVVQETIDRVNLKFDRVPKAKKTMHPLVGGVAHLRGCVESDPSGRAAGR